ncbi:DUF1003 domain-containing protein [Kitasatospora sp. NPDC018058]|uniref:DUF1003 domain-containing protein n=1 Tax=Kitasatospora sp. NPDC018058 TaxID=3364025 RepID=UPI0037BEB85D
MPVDTLGQRAADRVASAFGSWRFIVWMTVIIAVWLIWNTALPASFRFDEYPFIFLTLVLSLQASYAAPLILLAQNRQGDRDRARAEQDLVTDTETLGLVRGIAAHLGIETPTTS